MKKFHSTNHLFSAAIGTLILLGAAGNARSDALDELIYSLKSKGVISEADYQRISAAREAEKTAPASACIHSAASAKEMHTAPGADSGKSTAAVSSAGSSKVAASSTGSSKEPVAASNTGSSNTTQLTGRIQTDYRTYSNKAEPSTFEMRRVYLGVQGKFWNNIKYNITAHLNNTVANGGNSALEEAWVELPGNKLATLRIGQLFAPFGLDDASSSKYLDFMERAVIINQSHSASDNPDKGVMLYGEPVGGLSYWLAYTNGSSLNAVNSNAANGKETLVRGVANLAKVFEHKDAVYHLGYTHASGRKPADLTGGAEIGRIRTEGRSGNFRPMKFEGIDNDYDRTRQDLELAVAYGPFKFQSDIVRENYTGTTLGGIGYDKTVRGHYANFMWLLTGEKYADHYSGSSFGKIRPNRNFDLGTGGLGAWEIGVRFSRLDAGDLNPAAPAGVLKNAAGFATGMKGTTLGLKWVLNPNTRVYLNYVNSKYDQATGGGVAGLTPVGSDNAYMMRGQFDF